MVETLTGSRTLECIGKLKAASELHVYSLLLTAEGLYTVLDEQIPPQPDLNDFEAYEEMQDFLKRNSKASLYIIGSLEKSVLDSVKDIHTLGGKIYKLAELFNRQLTHAHSDVVSQIHNYKMSQGTPVMDHVIKMINLFEKLKSMGTRFDLQYKTDVILASLTSAYASFKMSYKMSDK
ncbi:uncharacterized protein LOC122662925 [Telopea speciosissima]|uniref:uncharacterized protein LOC122662925 n=1 Tax=Telopea speciosissima TaxID=54955 RepID=UPI001CC73042|nr:uncharacterized protein LOC122662925 [Telopea speciosissima]